MSENKNNTCVEKPQGPPETTLLQKRLQRIRRIGRGACVVLILIVCGHTIVNLFRLLDSFDEKVPPMTSTEFTTKEPPPFPVITFDPQGQWMLDGIHLEASATTQVIMPMPETAHLVGTRFDRNDVPLIQLFDLEATTALEQDQSIEQSLLQFWANQGWTFQSMNIPALPSYWCEHPDQNSFVQFFSEGEKHCVLICLAPKNFEEPVYY